MSNSNWQAILQRFENVFSDELLQSQRGAAESELRNLEDALDGGNATAADWILRGLEPPAMRLKPSRPPVGPTNPADRPVQNEPQTGSAPENEPLRPSLKPDRDRVREKLRHLAGQP